MRRMLAIVVILAFVSVSMSWHVSSADQMKAESGTIVVPDDYPSIQAAVNASNLGDTVFVRKGSYYEHVIVDKSISIIGEEGTVINGNGSGTVLEMIRTSNVTIENLTLEDGEIGLYIFESNYTKLINVNMKDSQYNFVFVTSTSQPQNLFQDIDASNMVNGKPIYFWINRQDDSIPQDAGFVALINCSSITVRGLTLAHNGDGVFLAHARDSVVENVCMSNNVEAIYLDSVDHCTVRNNSMRSNKRAASIENSDNNNFTDNTVMDNGDNEGFWISNSSFNVLDRNTIFNNSHAGIEITDDSVYNLIAENNITNNWYGINILSCSNNSISKNLIEANHYQNIWLWSSAHNLITGNTVNGNKTGNNLPGQKGIGLGTSNNNIITENVIENNYYGMEVYDSTNNSIYSNDFINNTYQTVFPDFELANIWDNGSTGNYWSNYTGLDSNKDGIGDSPYALNANNIDRYPLMSPHIIPEFPLAQTLLLLTALTLAVAGISRKRRI